MLTRNKPAISPSPPPSAFLLLALLSVPPLFDLLTSPLSFSLPSRLRFLFLCLSLFLPPSLSRSLAVAFPHGSSLTLRAPLFMSRVRMLLEDTTTGLARLSRALIRASLSVSLRLRASVAFSHIRSLARLPLSIVMHALARLLSACLCTAKLRVRNYCTRSRACFSRASFHFIYPSLSERFLALNIFTRKHSSKITRGYVFERLN